VAQALSAAQVVNDAEDRVQALAALSVRLPKGERAALLTQTLVIVQAIRDTGGRARALTSLAFQLTEGERAEVLEQALVDAHAIDNAESRARALTIFSHQLPEEEQTVAVIQALAAALAIESAGDRAKVLTDLVSMLARLQPNKLYFLWRRALLALARRAREDILSDLDALLPIIEALGGSEALEKTAWAILDVGRWWP
jgi:hypothetical protein